MRSVEDSAVFSRQIQNMFSAIAPRYDFLNRLLSVGRDRYWRKSAIDLLAPRPGEHILDVATGTGDMALEIASRSLQDVRVAGIDFSRRMLELGRNKIRRQGRERMVSLQLGSGENLPFADGSFDGAVCAFGIRNYADVKLGLREMFRVLKPGGRVVILEFSMPSNPVLRRVYHWYFDLVLPWVGNLVSGHDDAYSYLPESVAGFPDQSEFVCWMEEAGFQKASYRNLSFGIVALHCGYRE
ncbi:MAG: bifunctional demethylmenaquinone methyltransferase/2-methoxy-6-polyprenyl-1,4-benzoquinol methylase UbiE [Nitrospinae bacterium]|nr:bifunctional demethylmenaquinone methyltransferase/2-methoxy-6-polyprenyl-1,4-benzoquinol methylase UbiE [Nitrospinota bacterium]